MDKRQENRRSAGLIYTSVKKSGISQLRSYVVKTLKQPEFLMDPSSPLSIKNLTWSIVHNILYTYTIGINQDVMTKSKLKHTCLEVGRMSDDLSGHISDNDMIYVWLHIGETVEKWIEKAVELEQFESASNLKKLLENDY